MKKIVLLCCVYLCTLNLFAQPQGMPANKQMGAMKVGHVYGKIVDSTGKAISSASVMLLQNRFDTATKKNKQILLKGTSAAANGDFSFDELPVNGMLKLQISSTGYKPYEQSISFINGGEPTIIPQQAMPSFEKDLGKISLQKEINELQEVVVTTTKSSLKMDIDKKVYSVEKDIVNAGGTALDVMKNVPSVQVDIDGNVKLRNSAPQLYVDGRPTTLSLDQIPADAIDNVEVITNPSAKYDASGGNAGILNIVLKKNKKSGYNGNVRAGVDKRGGVNGGADISVRQGKFNVSASTMFNGMKNVSTGTTERLNLTGTPLTSVYQENTNRSTGSFLFGRVGVDFFASNKTTFSLSGTRVHGSFKPGDIINTTIDSLYNTGTTYSNYQRTSAGSREFNSTGLQFGMKHLFTKAGEELTVDGNISEGKNGNSSLYTTNYANFGTEYEKVMSDGTNKFTTIQADYTNPLSTNTKLETGVRAQFRNTISNNETFLQGIDEGVFTKVSSATSNYSNKDNVYAAYVSLKSQVNNFGYQLGLRAENSSYSALLTNTGESFSNKYPVSLFPSLFLSEKLANKQELQFGYTRRVNRPNFFQLIPYTDRTDKLNITQGNPDLVPEFTNSFELSYGKTYKKSNLLASLYYKKTTDLITRYQLQALDAVTGNTELINTFINANSSYSYGAEFTTVNNIAKWWDVTTNLNLYNSKINTDNVIGTSQAGMWSWFGKVNNTFKLPSNFSLQLTANYQSKTNLPVSSNSKEQGPPMMQAQSSAQGYIEPYYGIDAAIKKTFLKNNALSATLSFSDILRSRSTTQHSESPYFIQDYYRLNNPQMLRLTLGYRFGKIDMSLFKRKSTKGDDAQGVSDVMGQ